MVATPELIGKVTFFNVVRFFHQDALVAVIDIAAPIAERAFVGVHRIQNIFVFHHPIGIMCVFTFGDQRVQVAIFGFTDVTVVVAVFGIEDRRALARNYLLQFFELLKKRSIEVEVAAVVEGVPGIAPPDAIFVHLKGTVGRVRADDRFARGVAGAAVKLPLVAGGHQGA